MSPTTRRPAPARVPLVQELLPGAPPDLSGWAFAALYEPASAPEGAGGDVYDWCVLPDGRVLVLLGDVSGSGPRAVGTGLALRGALQALARTGEPLQHVALLDALVQAVDPDAFASLCLVELAPDSDRVGLLLAGHPRPLVRGADGLFEVCCPSNSLLGLGLGERWEHVEVEVRDGESLVLFSDGLAGARLPDGRLFAEGPLQACLLDLPPTASSFSAVLHVDRELRRASHRLLDDVVLVVLRRDARGLPDPTAAAPLSGAALVAARERSGLTQADVARELQVSQQTVSRWEAGRAVPRDRRRTDLARLLGLPLRAPGPAPADGGDLGSLSRDELVEQVELAWAELRRRDAARDQQR